MHWSLSLQVGVEWTPFDRLWGPRWFIGKHGWQVELGFGSLVLWVTSL